MTSKDVWFYLRGSNRTWTVDREVWQPYSFASDLYGNYKVTFNYDITKEDFLQVWQLIQRHKYNANRGVIPKKKLPEQGKLLYAIFKSRQKGLTYPAIFKLYSDRVLPYFEKGAASLGSEDKLEEYYRKYRPKLIDLW